MTNRIHLFHSKAAAIQFLNAHGWQRNPDLPGNWFKFPVPGEASREACVGRSSKFKGLWAVNIIGR